MIKNVSIDQAAKKPRTLWHYLFVDVLEGLLRPHGLVVDSFVKVGTLPL